MAVVAVLHLMALRIRNHTRIHEVRLRAITLRVQQLAYAKAVGELRPVDSLPTKLDGLIRYLVGGEIDDAALGEEEKGEAVLLVGDEMELKGAA